MKDLIQSLFEKTKTRSTLNADADGIIGRVVPKLLNVGASQDAVRQIATFRVNCFNDKNTTGLLLAQRPVRLFVENLLVGKNIAKVNLINYIFTLLEKELQDLGIPKLGHRPLKPENPLLYFHLATLKYNAYPFLCLPFHVALKHVEEILTDFKDKDKRSLPQKKAQQRLENIVIPFIHSVRFYEVDENDQLFTQSPSHDKIKQALRRGQGDSRVRYHQDEVVEAYTGNVLAALSGTYSPRSNKNVARVCWGRQLFYGKKYLEEIVINDADGAGSSKAFPTVINITFNHKTEGEAAEGAYPIEEAEEIFEAADNDLARVLSLRQISPSYLQSPWSKQSIPLNAYSSYCYAVTAIVIDAMTDEELAFLVFLVILIFFGFAPKKTANIVVTTIPVSEQELKHDTIYCHPDGTCFFYLIAEDQVSSIFAQKQDRSPGAYRDSGNVVVMTAGVIMTILKLYLNRTQSYRGASPFLFIYEDEDGKSKRFSLELFETIGKSLQDRFGPFPSVYAFSRSFVNYSTSRYHVDPIVSAYFADRVTRELRAPIFYTNLTSERLNDDLAEMQINFLNDIVRNAQECGLSVNSDIFCSADRDMSKGDKVKVSFGSKFVPLISSMKQTLKSIKGIFLDDQCQDLFKRYNTYMFYNDLLWELTCGFRQIEIERLDDADVDEENACIVVCGKGNRLHIESRLIFMHAFTTRIFRELRLCRSAFEQSLIDGGRYSPFEISEQLAVEKTFSLANSKGQLIPASSDNVRRFLVAAGIRFPYKLNSQRHLLRTFLFDKRVNYKYLAAFFGHQTKGKEFLSYFSLDRLKEMRNAISPHIEEFVDELDLEIISYTHVVTNEKD
ncbi:MAG: hypothetical protein ACLPX5_12835 [Dissulfurispiraceae bacterium]